MKIQRIGNTRAELEGFMSVWKPEGNRSQDLSEFAGRACYQSWDRPNPETATNQGYLGHILDVDHASVLEHGSVSYYVENVSRSLTHELVRHRHLSYSQLSQRFVVIRKVAHGQKIPFVIPPFFEGDIEAAQILSWAWDSAVYCYERLIEIGTHKMEGKTGTAANKMIREAARAVLPNMTPTAIVVTGNHRAWREFIDKRATLQADAEICRLAVMVFRDLAKLEPNIYQDRMVFNTGEREWVGVV
jgi:thymidylate synthase (FAD)